MKNELIYGLNDKPPFSRAIFAALVHLLAMFVAVITPSLIIGKAIGLSDENITRIVSMSLFASGVAGFIQMMTFKIKNFQIGSGLLSIQGTSFNFVSVIISGGLILRNENLSDEEILAAIFGTLMLCSVAEMIVSMSLKYVRRVISDLVCGIVVMLIGLTLISAGLVSAGGGYASMDKNIAENLQFASIQNLSLSGIVLLSIVILNSLKQPFIKVSALFFAILIGIIYASLIGRFDISDVHASSTFIYPIPLFYGLSIESSLILPFAIIFIVTSLETIGDISATSELSNQPTQGKDFERRLRGGVFANGLNSCVSGFFNTFPNSCFGQNNAVIALSGVASRYVGYIVCIMLIICGVFPVVAQFALRIPEPVLGGAILVMFGTIAATGIKIISRATLDKRALMILAISLALGLGVSTQPAILEHFPSIFKTLFSSAIATGGLCAILLELFLPKEKNNS
ncbi:uracil-xanthine permease family protein [Campylobacter canadensis]|uniref:Purine/pyrimidine permease n=1 Tax=Campylobacter canadensis TaxID=449520 RepID=A0ABS7WRV7_9BACT|nr:solute carrier family 23 protein [Campylobacter canadensis]MBZ7986735.1 purine/pyrimidine permease [Campylobacter canadensis]MBZ7996864.1 purine/pyrimidine permease [Campylobacter canadensis]MBZ7997772.1 purine/pyrimidine permease [Campylobacter canadensis]MBZ7999907.1 purine/pyrimidine permease [Campylobacter canadensis]MBZ8001765.1 purine/pyrimidine permease [Campylobacter canadensis]